MAGTAPCPFCADRKGGAKNARHPGRVSDGEGKVKSWTAPQLVRHCDFLPRIQSGVSLLYTKKLAYSSSIKFITSFQPFDTDFFQPGVANSTR